MHIRSIIPVLALAALIGCAQWPTAPTQADFERALANPVVAQPSLGGRITDAVTGEPVADVAVTVQGRSVFSSRTGHYLFNPNLTAGVFPVQVRHVLYVDHERDVEVKPYATADFALQRK